jgi:hypothetical protein
MNNNNRNLLQKAFQAVLISTLLFFSYGCEEESDPSILAINSLDYGVDNIPEIKVGSAYTSEVPAVDAEGELSFGIADVSNSNLRILLLMKALGKYRSLEATA